MRLAAPDSACSRRAALSAVLATSALLAGPRARAADEVKGVLTPSGLRYFDFAVGSGPEPRWGQLLRIHYVGYTSGKAGDQLVPFDASYERGDDGVFLEKHGNGLQCQGIEEALHTMKVGGKRRIILPPRLGYTGDKGPIPPSKKSRDQLFDAVTAGEPIIFDLELVSAMDDAFDRGDYDDLSQDDLPASAAEGFAAPPAESKEPPPTASAADFSA